MIDIDTAAQQAPESTAASPESELDLEPNRFDLLPNELVRIIGSLVLRSIPDLPFHSTHTAAQLQYHVLIAISRRWHRILVSASPHFSSAKVFVGKDKADRLLAAIEDGRSIPTHIQLVLESTPNAQAAAGALIRACAQNLKVLAFFTKANQPMDIAGHIPGDVIWNTLRSLSLVEFRLSRIRGPMFSVPTEVVAGLLQCWPALKRLNLSDLALLPATGPWETVAPTKLKALVYRVDCEDALTLFSSIMAASPSLAVVDAHVPCSSTPNGVTEALLPACPNLVSLKLFNCRNFRILLPTLRNLRHLQLGVTKLNADANASPEPLLDALHLISTLRTAKILIPGNTQVTPDFMTEFMDKSNPELGELTLRLSTTIDTWTTVESLAVLEAAQSAEVVLRRLLL